MSLSDSLAHLTIGNTTCVLLAGRARATDHDEAITFGGLTYEVRAALAGSELSDRLGLAVAIRT